MRHTAGNTIFDLCAGAALGIMLAACLLVGDLNVRQMTFDSASPVMTTLTLVGAIVGEFSVGAALSGVVIRMLAPQT